MEDTSPTAKTIVLADDDQFITVAYRDGLERAGYAVKVAHDGEQALELIKNESPQLVLLDIIMPKTNGFEVLRTMRNDPLLAGIPVIVLTNLSQETDRQEAMSSGAKDFITKSDISLNDVVARIKRVLGE